MNTKLLVGLLVLVLLVTACTQNFDVEQESEVTQDEQVEEPQADATDEEASEELEAGYIEEDSSVELGEVY